MDRRLLFALLAVAVTGTLLLQPVWHFGVSDSTRRIFDAIEALDTNAVVMVSFDHEAASLPEVGPLAEAITEHCYRRGVRVVGLALFAEGTVAGYEVLSREAAAHGKEYGRDWMYLGYRPQYVAAILGMGESISGVFASDYGGTPLEKLDLGRRVRNYADVSLVISVADGSMATYWVEYAGARYHAKIAVALAAVMVTSYVPYLEAGQLVGIVAGFRGAGEYEQLLNRSGPGSRGMAAQTVAHALIALLVVVGNVEPWVRRWRARRTRQDS